MRFLFLLLLAGCSANQGAFPVAPPLTPSMDAPIVVGQPGYVGDPEKAPRSPHKRVLPETPETMRQPGIWAGDGPQKTTVLGMLVPVPETTETGANLVSMCAGITEDTLYGMTEGPKQYAKLEEASRACFTANAVWDCLRLGLQEAVANHRPDALIRDYRAAIDVVGRHATRVCGGVVSVNVADLLRLWGIALVAPRPDPKVRH